MLLKYQIKKLQKNKKIIVNIFRICISLLFLFIVTHNVGIKDLLKTLQATNLFFFVLAGIISIISFFISAFNLWLIINVFNKINFLYFLKTFSYGSALSLIVPGQIGDVSIPFLLKKEGIAITNSGLSYLINKLISLSFILLITFIGIIIYLPFLKVYKIIIIFFVLVSLLLFLLFLFIKIKIKNKKIFKFQQYIFGIIDLFIKNKKYWYILVVNLIITIFIWFITVFLYILIFKSLGQVISFKPASTIPFMASLVGYIPVSLGGLGTVEYTGIYLFSSIGIQSSIVLSSYICIRFWQYLIAIISVFASNFIIYKKK